MKIYKLNSLTTLFFTLTIVGLVFFMPIVLIEALWNSTLGKTYANINIDFWQALILWLIFIVVLNILGVFKFEFAVEATDSFDKELVKKKLEDLKNLQNKTQENSEVEVKSTSNKEN